MTDVERYLEAQTVEGEIGLVIDYQPGRVLAVDVLQTAMQMIHALDRLDATLLSSVDTSLEPVSVLNDVQHSSLKMLLARALRNTPDEHLGSLEWKKWVGGLLVKGKYKLLQKLDADAPQVHATLLELAPEYEAAPAKLVGYKPPAVGDVMDALSGVAKARALMPGQLVKVQTEMGDVYLPDVSPVEAPTSVRPVHEVVKNSGTEFFKIKYPDMLGDAQWTVIRNNRNTRIDMLHKRWLDDYHRRKFSLQPGDSLKCRYEESIGYDDLGNEVERHLAVIEVLDIISPPAQVQTSFDLPSRP